MAKRTVDLGRRKAMKLVLTGVAAVPVAGLVGGRVAYSQDLPQVAEDDPAAVGLKYLHDASKAERTDKAGTAAADQLCSNCQFIGSDSGEWRPCALFPGKAVNENGWCSAWAPKA
jgi:hypothetical protein